MDSQEKVYADCIWNSITVGMRFDLLQIAGYSDRECYQLSEARWEHVPIPVQKKLLFINWAMALGVEWTLTGFKWVVKPAVQS